MTPLNKDFLEFIALLEKERVEYEGMHMPFIGKQDLIRNKLAAGRPKDRLDVEELTDKE